MDLPPPNSNALCDMPMRSTLPSFFWRLKMLRDPDHNLWPGAAAKRSIASLLHSLPLGLALAELESFGVPDERQRRWASKPRVAPPGATLGPRAQDIINPNGVAPFGSAIARGQNPDGVLGSSGTVTQGSRSFGRGNPGLRCRTPLAFFLEQRQAAIRCHCRLHTNPAIASGLDSGHHRRGVGEPERSATTR